MSNVTVSMKMTAKQSGALYMKNIKLVSANEKLEARIAEIEADKIELIAEFAEASCMGDLSKIARNHGYDQQAGELQ